MTTIAPQTANVIPDAIVIPDNYRSYMNAEDIKTIEKFNKSDSEFNIIVPKPIIINGIILTEEELDNVKKLHNPPKQNMVMFGAPKFDVKITDTKHTYTVPFKIGPGDIIKENNDTIFLSYFQIAEVAVEINPYAPKKFGFFKFKVSDFIRTISDDRTKKTLPALVYPLTVKIEVGEQSANAKAVAASVQCVNVRDSLLEELAKIRENLDSEYSKFLNYKKKGCPTNSSESAGTSSPPPKYVFGSGAPFKFGQSVNGAGAPFQPQIGNPASTQYQFGTSPSFQPPGVVSGAGAPFQSQIGNPASTQYQFGQQTPPKQPFGFGAGAPYQPQIGQQALPRPPGVGTGVSSQSGKPGKPMSHQSKTRKTEHQDGGVVKRKRNIKKRTRRLSVIRRNKRRFFRKKTVRKKNKRRTRKIRKYQGRE